MIFTAYEQQKKFKFCAHQTNLLLVGFMWNALWDSNLSMTCPFHLDFVIAWNCALTLLHVHFGEQNMDLLSWLHLPGKKEGFLSPLDTSHWFNARNLDAESNPSFRYKCSKVGGLFYWEDVWSKHKKKDNCDTFSFVSGKIFIPKNNNNWENQH